MDNKDSQFTDSDRAALDHARTELQEYERRAWLWRLIGRGAKWLVAFIAGATVVADAAVRLWRGIQE